MSISEVAKIANVPYATAWRIINKRVGSSEESVVAVNEAMRKLNYVPGQSRRGRPRHAVDGIRTHNIALLHMREGTAISTSILSGVQRMLATKNLNLIFAHVDGPDGLPQAVKSGNLDGILGYGEFPEPAASAAVRRIPAVWMMSRADGQSDLWGDRIKPDHEVIGRLAAQYLINRQHQRVAYFHPRLGFSVYDQRGEWFSRTWSGAQPVTVISGQSAGDNWLDSAASAFVKQWLALPDRPTGVFCPVDRLTVRLYSHLMRAGIQPGRDVDFVSCDNEIALLSLIHPQPPSIDLNRGTVARLAVERLLWRMRHGMGSPSIVTTVSPTLDADGVTPWSGSD